MGTEGFQESYINPYTDFGFKKLFGTELNKELEAAEIARFTPREVAEYEESLKIFRDWYSVMKTAKDKGRAEGCAEERCLIARSMKAEGLTIEMIVKFAGLSHDEISDL